MGIVDAINAVNMVVVAVISMASAANVVSMANATVISIVSAVNVVSMANATVVNMASINMVDVVNAVLPDPRGHLDLMVRKVQ
uniref:Transmembrane protein n=1 Tax=Pithovirus LCPAC103 TaxID=2506588 RepID=A0A481Z4A2_9VIRU|nr:MAG: hypothetical protein LCPAC103_00260 [Pithovirus LCPAC103]